jgi:glycosyltransferase involved in cell wall biosynthesis
MDNKFTINGRFLTQNVTGVQRYAREITSILTRTKGNELFSVVTPRLVSGVPFNQFGATPVGRLSGHLWEQAELPYFTRDQLLLNLCNTGPLCHRNQVTVIHDAAVFAAPSGFSKNFLAWYRYLLPRICRRSRLVVTVSEFSKTQLVKYCGADSRCIAVVPNGVDHIDRIDIDPDTLQKFHLEDHPFVLGVGSLHPNKNFGLFIKVAEALAEMGVEFVVAGGGDSQVFADAGLASDQVRFLGYVTDGELKALYTHAACLVFPSFYEGFGIPPLEAMRCGCPVIASDAASLPEVCGDAALYASPDSAEEFSQQVTRILTSESLRDELAVKGRLRANDFRWEVSAQLLATLVSPLI